MQNVSVKNLSKYRPNVEYAASGNIIIIIIIIGKLNWLVNWRKFGWLKEILINGVSREWRAIRSV